MQKDEVWKKGDELCGVKINIRVVLLYFYNKKLQNPITALKVKKCPQ